MQIAIIFYSFSGHTLSVSRKLEKYLKNCGYHVALERLEPAEPFKLTAVVSELKRSPSIEKYSILILASPVHGGRIASPLAGFLKNIPHLKGKKVFCLVTHFLPYSMGGREMIQFLKDACESLGAEVIGTGNVPRLSFRQNYYINQVVEAIKNQPIK